MADQACAGRQDKKAALLDCLPPDVRTEYDSFADAVERDSVNLTAAISWGYGFAIAFHKAVTREDEEETLT